MLVVGEFSLQKVVKMLEEVVVGWQEVRWIWWMRQNFLVQFVQLLKCCLCKLQSGVVVENRAPSVAQCQLQALQFPVNHQLLSILLTCNGFPGDSGGCSGSNGQQTTKPWPWPFFFFGSSLALESALELLDPTTELVIFGCHIQSTFHRTSQSRNGLLSCRIREDDTSNPWFFDLQSAYACMHAKSLQSCPTLPPYGL